MSSPAKAKLKRHCHLLALPAELRLIIYEFVLYSTVTVRSWTSTAPLQHSLLRTSALIQADARHTYVRVLRYYHNRLSGVYKTAMKTTIRALEMHLTYARWLLGSFDLRSGHEFEVEIKLRNAIERLDADRLRIGKVVERSQEQVEREPDKSDQNGSA